MTIQPIVEGHGEVAAVPVLLRRLRDIAQTYPMEVNAPIQFAECLDQMPEGPAASVCRPHVEQARQGWLIGRLVIAAPRLHAGTEDWLDALANDMEAGRLRVL